MTESNTRPRAERTQLQHVIAGLTEGVIFIDPDRSIAWANQTALALHGVRELGELGRTASEYRRRFELRYMNRQKLEAHEYPMERLLAGETFSEVMVIVTRPGETRHRVHEVRSLVLTEPKGAPDCLVLILNDETERFNAEERFERAFGANPAPAIIARLSDMRYVKVNHGFLELTGLTREALIGHFLHEFDVLRGAEKRDLALARLHAGATIPQMEACLGLPGGAEKTVLIGGQPIEIGDEACMLFTFADLHPRKRAEDALRQSEERFAKTFRMAPGPMAILALDGLRILDVNDAFTAATGWRREEVIGRGEAEVEMWGQGELREQLARQIRQTGHVRSVDIQLRTKQGDLGDYLLSAETVTIHHQHCVLSVMLDISERKRMEAELLAALGSVMQDTSWFGQKIAEKLAGITGAGRAGAPAPELAALSLRVRQVLDLVAQGLGDEEIARRLGITRNTVRNHISVIYHKSGIHRRAAVVAWARERGLGAAAKSLTQSAKLKPRKPR